MKYDSFLYVKIIDPFFDLVSAITWDGLRKKLTGRAYNLKPQDWIYIARLLEPDYYVILNFRKSHLSTYFVMLGVFLRGLLKGKIVISKWSHAFCNLEKDVPDFNLDNFRFKEATAKGVITSKFRDVFNCDGVVLLKVKGYSRDELRAAADSLLEYNGRQYDNLHSLANDLGIDCCELMRLYLRKLPDYDMKLANFEEMVQRNGSLVPQDFYDCPDFEVVYEIRR